jgi:hypothetical protein
MNPSQTQSATDLALPNANADRIHAIVGRNETATAAATAAATAQIQARYVVALQRPRDIDIARERILRASAQPGFARSARYVKPIGKNGVEGPSIRFVEEALRALGNVVTEKRTVFDDETKRILNVSITDLETNATYGQDITVEKTVERSHLSGRQSLASRTNSSGGTVYLVEATEDEFMAKEAAQVSKVTRQLGLRIIPGYIVEEAMERVRETLLHAAKKAPEIEMKKILDAFALVAVTEEQLVQYLGHPIKQLTAEEIVELRKLYQALDEGETDWDAALQEAQKSRPVK